MPVFRAEPDVLRHLLGLTMARGAGRLPDPATAAVAYYLLDVEDGGAELFLTRTLGRLIRYVDHEIEQRRVASRGRVRGRISWPATVQARYAQDYDPGRYVCREVRRRYDTPENQLVKYLVESLGRPLQTLPEVIRAGAGYLPAVGRMRTEALPTASRLARMETAVATFRRSPYFRDVTLPREITSAHLTRAETSRVTEYAEAVRVYRRYRAALAAAPWEEVARTGRRILLLPGRADAEGEPWLHLGVRLLTRENVA